MTRQIQLPMSERAYSLWQRVPKDMQESALEGALTFLWRDEVFFHTFFEGKIEKDEIRIPLCSEEFPTKEEIEESNKPEFNF